MENSYETILVETPAEGVGLIRMNRPCALNALNGQLTNEMFTNPKDQRTEDYITGRFG